MRTMAKYTMEELAAEYVRVSEAVCAEFAKVNEYDAHKAAHLALYRDCVREMLTMTVKHACYDAWEDEAFREKWNGTPFRYKRFAAAAFDWLPEGWRGFVGNQGTVFVYFPTGGAPHDDSVDFMAYRFDSWDLGNYHDHYFEYKPEDDCYRAELPSLDEVDAMCRRAEELAREYRNEIDAVIDHVSDEVKKSSLGLSALYDTLKPNARLY